MGISIDGLILWKKGGDEELLEYYYQELMQVFNSRGWSVDVKFFILELLREQFEVVFVDWMWFMVGWGWWGNVGWVESNVCKIFK